MKNASQRIKIDLHEHDQAVWFCNPNVYRVWVLLWVTTETSEGPYLHEDCLVQYAQKVTNHALPQFKIEHCSGPTVSPRYHMRETETEHSQSHETNPPGAEILVRNTKSLVNTQSIMAGHNQA